MQFIVYLGCSPVQRYQPTYNNHPHLFNRYQLIINHYQQLINHYKQNHQPNHQPTRPAYCQPTASLYRPLTYLPQYIRNAHVTHAAHPWAGGGGARPERGRLGRASGVRGRGAPLEACPSTKEKPPLRKVGREPIRWQVFHATPGCWKVLELPFSVC